MSNLADALNGGKVQLWALTNSNWEFIGGQTAHSKALTLEAIDISNKALPDNRCFLEQEGRVTADVTGEILWSSDAAYQYCRDKADAKEFVELQVRYTDDLTRVDQFTVLITSVSEPTDQNAAVSSSITFNSTSDFSTDISFELAIDTLPEDAVDTLGNLAYGITP